jgi:16S rRNA U1498 N3-methylase RsmE
MSKFQDLVNQKKEEWKIKIQKMREKQIKFENNLVKFMDSQRTKDVLGEYNFSSEKVKDIIERNYRLGVYNIIFILSRDKILWDVLDIYTKSPSNWTDEDKFITSHNLLNKYKI